MTLERSFHAIDIAVLEVTVVAPSTLKLLILDKFALTIYKVSILRNDCIQLNYGWGAPSALSAGFVYMVYCMKELFCIHPRFHTMSVAWNLGRIQYTSASLVRPIQNADYTVLLHTILCQRISFQRICTQHCKYFGYLQKTNNILFTIISGIK